MTLSNGRACVLCLCFENVCVRIVGPVVINYVRRYTQTRRQPRLWVCAPYSRPCVPSVRPQSVFILSNLSQRKKKLRPAFTSMQNITKTKSLCTAFYRHIRSVCIKAGTKFSSAAQPKPVWDCKQSENLNSTRSLFFPQSKSRTSFDCIFSTIQPIGAPRPTQHQLAHEFCLVFC